MKKISVEEVKRFLHKEASAEPDGTYIVYYLHMYEDGTIAYDCYHADKTFTVQRDVDEYFGKNAIEDDWGASCFEAEEDPDSDFDGICKELTAQANVWLAELEEEGEDDE